MSFTPGVGASVRAGAGLLLAGLVTAGAEGRELPGAPPEGAAVGDVAGSEDDGCGEVAGALADDRADAAALAAREAAVVGGSVCAALLLGATALAVSVALLAAADVEAAGLDVPGGADEATGLAVSAAEDEDEDASAGGADCEALAEAEAL